MPLTDFRVEGEGAPPIHLPVLKHKFTVLAFDQAMRNTGVTLLNNRPGSAHLAWAATLRTRPNTQEGWKSTYASQMDMADQIIDVINMFPEVDVIVHETPPTGKLARPDASIMAGMAIRVAARLCESKPTVWMIGKQKAANILLGNANADKKMIKKRFREMESLDPPFIWDLAQIAHNTYNEHQYDALALAVAALVLGGEG